MNLKFLIFLTILILFSSCEKLHDDRSVILLNSEYNRWLNSQYGYEVWKPEQKDIEIVDKVLKKAIEKNEFNFIKKPILENITKNLYKQYIPYIDENGDRIILLNTFCRILKISTEKDDAYELREFDWKSEHYGVNDGGFCYWRITINVDKEEYFNLMVNGV